MVTEEISPAIAMAISSSKARVVLIPMNHCRAYIAGVEEKKALIFPQIPGRGDICKREDYIAQIHALAGWLKA